MPNVETTSSEHNIPTKMPASYEDLIRVYFYDPDAGKVDLVWGINGWQSVPKSYWTQQTSLNEKGSLTTEMNRLGDGRFSVDLRVPAGAKVDVGFSIRETLDGFTTARWIEGSPLNHMLVRQGRTDLPGKRLFWQLIQAARKIRGKTKSSRINSFTGIQWRKTTYTRFVVLTQARTGSTMLGRSLKSHPNIAMKHELFNPKDSSQAKQKQISAKFSHPVEALTEFLDNHIYQDYDQTIQAAGFKVAYNHRFVGNWDVVWRYLQRTGVHVVHLKRRNLLDRYLSFALAMRSKQWVAKDAERNKRYNKPIEIDPADCIASIKRTLKEYDLYDHLFRDNPKIELIYEDLVDNRDAEISRLLHFLGVDDRPLEVQTTRQRQKPKSELIINYDLLQAAFQARVASGELPSNWLTYFDD